MNERDFDIDFTDDRISLATPLQVTCHVPQRAVTPGLEHFTVTTDEWI